MKKIIGIFIAILLLSSCLIFTVNADDGEFTVSDDFQTVTYKGITYHRTDLSAVSIIYYNDLSEQPQLSPALSELLRNCIIRMDASGQIMESEFFFRDGSTLYCGFMAEDSYQSLQDALEGDEVNCYVELYWDESRQFNAPERHFKGTATVLTGRQLQNADTYPVYVNQDNPNFQIIKGTLLVSGDRFYYANHKEADYYYAFPLDTSEYDSLECYEITDTALVADLRDGMGQFYDVAYSSEDILGIAAAVFWVLLFGVIPGGILVLSIIFWVRGKGYHRTVWKITGFCAAGELVTMAVVTVTMVLSLYA